MGARAIYNCVLRTAVKTFLGVWKWRWRVRFVFGEAATRRAEATLEGGFAAAVETVVTVRQVPRGTRAEGAHLV